MNVAYLPYIDVKDKSEDKSGGKNFRVITLGQAVTPMEADWADAHLTGETIVRPAKRNVRVWQGPDGSWWRDGGFVTYQRCRTDGGYRFIIRLAKGANDQDYRFLRKAVDRAREGAFLNHGWVERHHEDVGTYWSYSYDREYVDPHEYSDDDLELIVCEDPRCRQEFHDADGDTHDVDEICTREYTLSVTRFCDRDHEEIKYCVCVYVGGADMTPAQAESFVSDIRWLTEECRKANATPVDPHKKSIHTTGGGEAPFALEQRTA